MSHRVVTSRFALAALLLLPCSLLVLRHWHRGGAPGGDDELPLAPAVRLTRDSKPTIVKPSDDWMDGSAPHDPLAPDGAGMGIDPEPPDVPFLPPPLQTADQRGAAGP